MSASRKVLRLLGALLVTIALVPWLSMPTATADPGDKAAAKDAGTSAADIGESAAKASGRGNGSGTGNGDDGRQGKGGAESAAVKKGADQAGSSARQGDKAKAAHAKKPAKANAKAKAAGSGRDKAAGAKGDRKTGVSAGKASGDRTAGRTAGGPGFQKVTLCHRTNSETNPYVRITVSVNSVVKSSGHDSHEGPVFAAGMKAAQQKWGDIIPSFTYTTKSGSTATYGGKNWPTGQALFDAGCAAGTQPTPTTSVTPTGSTTPSPTVTVTSTPTNPPTTITVTPSPSIPTLSPTGTVPTSPDTSVLPTRVPPGDGGGDDDGGDDGDDDTSVLGNKFGPLASTGLGLPLGVVIALSLVLLFVGGALMAAPELRQALRSPERRH